MSDRLKTAPDVRFRPVGTGLAATFRCNACGIFRQVPGRKLVQMRGLIRKQYVCKKCLQSVV